MPKPLRSYEDVHAPKKPVKGVKRFKERRQPDFMEWVPKQGYPCVRVVATGDFSKCWGPMERMHLKSRGAAGKDLGNVVMGCTGCHRHLHRVGQRQFEFEIGMKLKPYARKVETHFLDYLSGKSGSTT